MAHVKQLRSSLFVALVTLVTCVTAWIMFAGKPELFERTSDDGFLFISGTSYNARALYIASNSLGDFTTYTVLPEALATQAALSLEYRGDDQLFVMDVAREAWRPIEKSLDSQGHILFAAGAPSRVDLANYDIWQNEAIVSPPEGAVSYEQFITYQVGNALPSYLAPTTVRQASCAETFYRTEHTEEQKDIKEVRMPVDDVSQLVRMTLTTRWFINSGSSGCDFALQE
jgi:hypothetical protein